MWGGAGRIQIHRSWWGQAGCPSCGLLISAFSHRAVGGETLGVWETQVQFKCLPSPDHTFHIPYSSRTQGPGRSGAQALNSVSSP